MRDHEIPPVRRRQSQIQWHWLSFIGQEILNVEMMPKILGYLLMLKFLLSDIRFLALFRHLEESTQFG